MAMLITLFLVLINIFNTVTSASPNTEGMNAITAWMLVCIFFVFGALGMQYALHNSFEMYNYYYIEGEIASLAFIDIIIRLPDPQIIIPGRLCHKVDYCIELQVATHFFCGERKKVA